MTEKEWKEEVGRALAAAGLPWGVSAAWVQQNSFDCVAELVDSRSGKERSIKLSHQRFPTEAERRAEIVRQVQALKA